MMKRGFAVAALALLVPAIAGAQSSTPRSETSS
jgi:hypothetical protein